jgi:hypothetical protein
VLVVPIDRVEEVLARVGDGETRGYPIGRVVPTPGVVLR